MGVEARRSGVVCVCGGGEIKGNFPYFAILIKDGPFNLRTRIPYKITAASNPLIMKCIPWQP